MRKFAWFTTWSNARPSIGSDEFARKTLVLPWPVGQVQDGERAHPALVVVIAPWWVTREVWDPQVRAYLRHERAYMTSLYKVWDPDAPNADEVWEEHHGQWAPLAPPTPARWLTGGRITAVVMSGDTGRFRRYGVWHLVDDRHEVEERFWTRKRAEARFEALAALAEEV